MGICIYVYLCICMCLRLYVCVSACVFRVRWGMRSDAVTGGCDNWVNVTIIQLRGGRLPLRRLYDVASLFVFFSFFFSAGETYGDESACCGGSCKEMWY